VVVHAATIQDADSVGDLLRRLKRLYCWLRVVFADGVPVHGRETPICAYAAMGSWPI
jgi:hypothetical protein